MTVTTLTPYTSDGKPISLVNMFSGDVTPNYAGAGDDVINGVRFGGQEFMLSSIAQEQKTLEWRFMEWIYLAGGIVLFKGATLGDWMTFEVYAPATTASEGGGLFAKQAVAAGVNRFIPQEGGGWVLNLTEKYSANVGFTKVVPVPNPNGTGYFDWDEDTEAVAVNAEGKGGFDLYDVPIPLTKHVSKARLLGDHITDLTVPAVKPKKLLAHWIHKLTLNNSSAKTLELAWTIYLARRKTT